MSLPLFVVSVVLTAVPGAGGEDRPLPEQIAREVAAQKLSVDAARLEVESVVATEWPDASLGCPQKEMVYAQVVTSGHRVTLRLGDKAFRVHVTGARGVLCGENAGAPATAPGEVAAAARVYGLARKNLASRLHRPEAKIAAVFVRPTTWPDAGLGCPEPDRSYEPA